MKIVALLAAAGVVALGITTAQATPADRIVNRCLLEVDGRAYIDGPCRFVPYDDGGFLIGELNVPTTRLAWSAVAWPDGSAWWNDDEGYPASHLHSKLGPMRREGACFVSERAKVCAWAEEAR